jgi:hypothetical protein
MEVKLLPCSHYLRVLLQINRCIIVANGWKRLFIFTHLYPLQLFAWNEFAMKIQQKQKETFLLFFCEAMILQQYYSAFETVQKQSTCNETLSKRYRTVHLQRNDSPQQPTDRNELRNVSGETLWKQFCNGIAMVSSDIRFRNVLRGNDYATIISVSQKNGFRFAKKR